MDSSALIATFLAGWTHDLDTLLTVFTDDVIYSDMPMQAELKGKEDLSNFAQAFFSAFPDIQFTLFGTPVLSQGRAAFEWRVTGTHKGQLLDIAPTNRTIDFTGASFMEFKDGKISSTIDYWDMKTLLRQIGH